MRAVVGWGNIHMSLFSCSTLVTVSVLLPHVPQKEESIEQPEFHYDEFGFRVDKEGKVSPIPNPSIVSGSSPSRVHG